MKLRILLIAVIGIFIGFQLNAQTVDEVIAKNLDARGGADKIKAVTSWKIEAKQSQMGMEIPLLVYTKSPNKFRVEVEAMGMKRVMAAIGDKGWAEAGGQVQDIPAQAIENLTEIIDMLITGPLMIYKDKGATAELTGKVKEEGRKSYVIKINYPDGMEYLNYVDVNDNELFKSWTKVNQGEQNMEINIYFKDYKKVGDILIPHKIEIKAGENNTDLVVEKIEPNVKVEDSLFDKPEPAKKDDK